MALAVALTLAGCGKGGAKDEHAAEGDKHAEHAGEKKGERKGEETHAEGAEELTLTAEEAERAGVKVEAIKSEALGETLQVTATIRPDQDRLARVAPRIEGRITSAPAKLGDRVRAGQTLATLDSVAVAEAHATWVQAQSELRVAEADFKRAESLNAEEIIPRKDFLRAQADRDKAAAVGAKCRRPAAPARWRAGGQRQRRSRLRGHRAFRGHRHREEGHVGRTGQPGRDDVHRR
jgi:cobalt-zinc-cadmium efflux system membrane fusion protein